MIQINTIPLEACELYNPQDEFMGIINEYQFNDIRIQIKKEQAEGYYCIFNLPKGKTKLSINKNGKCDGWTEGTFTKIEYQLMELL